MKPIQTLEEKTTLAQDTQIALGYALPLYVPYFRQKVTVQNAEDGDKYVAQPVTAGAKGEDTSTGTQDAEHRASKLRSQAQGMGAAVFISPMQLWMDTESEASAFELPFDPVISVSGSNSMVKRNVAKKVGGGTVKEFWSTDDYSISISGSITADEQADCDAIVWRMRQLFTEGRTGLNVACPGLNDAFDIYRMVVESFEFPFTAGIGNQDVTITCVSDEMYDLFIPVSNA